MNASTILAMDITDRYIARAVAKMSNSWTTAEKIELLNKVSASKDQVCIQLIHTVRKIPPPQARLYGFDLLPIYHCRD